MDIHSFSIGFHLKCRYSRLPSHLEIRVQSFFPVLLSCQSNLTTLPQGRLVCWQPLKVARVTDASKTSRQQRRVSFGLADKMLLRFTMNRSTFWSCLLAGFNYFHLLGSDTQGGLHFVYFSAFGFASDFLSHMWQKIKLSHVMKTD